MKVKWWLAALLGVLLALTLACNGEPLSKDTPCQREGDVLVEGGHHYRCQPVKRNGTTDLRWVEIST